MSYGSRTQYPSTSRTRRGRGGSNSYSPHLMARPMAEQSESEDPHYDDNPHSSHGGNEDSELPYNQVRGRGRGEVTRGRSMRNHGAHYVLQPDPSKNSKLKKTATEEEAKYVRYKDEKRERLGRVEQTPKAVGGVEHTLREISALREQQEKQQQKEARYAAVRRKQKRDEYQRVLKEKEDAELLKKKMAQREKAVTLEVRKQEQQRLQQEDLRTKRSAYFDQAKKTTS